MTAYSGWGLYNAFLLTALMMHMYFHYIVRLFPEITIKSSPVRKKLTKQVRENLRKLLQRVDKGIEVQRDWEKIEVWVPETAGDLRDQVERVLANTPGVAKFSRVQTHPLVSLEDMGEKVKAAWSDRLEGKTFCARVRRRGSHAFSSMDAEKYLGSILMASSGAKGVDLRNPDLRVAVEVQDDRFHLVEDSVRGLGGFPIGSQDSVLSLISGGYDSTVASYLTMKRGLHTHFCFFNLGGRAHELGVKEVALYLWQKFGASHRVKFVTVPFEGVVSEILARVDNAHMGVILKRMMYRAATAVAQGLGVNALVSGESVAQVSSQTLVNLRVIDEVTDMLTLRPLAVMDKGDIIDIARAIGTEAFAASMPEYCGVISVRPTTRARRERVIQEEAAFDMAVLEKAIADRREENIDSLLMEDGELPQDAVPVHAVPLPEAVIVDIRHPDQVRNQGLKAGSAEIINVPFFELERLLPRMDMSRQYMLFCDRGVMSRLHAQLLREKGYDNILVYRPAIRGPRQAGES